MLVILIRTIILYIGIIVMLRILGKRQLGELEASEFVLTLLISDLASVPMQDIGTPLLHGFIPILIMVGMEFLITFGVMKSLKFRGLICGKPSIVIRNGIIDQKEMDRSRISVDELLEELRTKNVTDLSQVKYGILETSGELSTILFSEYLPLTARDMQINKQNPGLPVVMINDGRLIRKNLPLRNVDESWIRGRLAKQKKPSGKPLGCSDVFLLTVDEMGNVYLSEKETDQKERKS